MMKSRIVLEIALAAVAVFDSQAFAQTAPVGAALKSDLIMLTVDKQGLQAELRTWPEDHWKAHTLKSFRIAIGKAEGDKQVEGDNRTPEGVYFAQSHIAGSTLPEKYGDLAIPLDFPNPIDTLDGKTGHGIWLHGVDRAGRIEEAKVTEGCVAFYNEDIARLSSWLKAYQGVIVITKDGKDANKPEDVGAVRLKTLEWLQAWANRKIDAYASFYSKDFVFNGMNIKSYTEYKKKVFGSYKTIKLAYDSLRVVSHPKYAVSLFNQDFKGDQRFSSLGRKVLYWEKMADGSWQIKREIFENRRFEFLQFGEAELALLSGNSSSISSEDKDKKAPSL